MAGLGLKCKLVMGEIKCRLKATGGVMQNAGVVYPAVIDAGRIDAGALVDLMVRNCNVAQSQVLAVLSGLAEVLTEMLALGHSVEVPGLGFFALGVKGGVVAKKNGKCIVDNARGYLKFKPKEKLAKHFSDITCKVVSAKVRDNVTITHEEAVKVADVLIERYQFFSVNDYAEEVKCSPNYARRVLGWLVEQNQLRCARLGRMSVFCQYKE